MVGRREIKPTIKHTWEVKKGDRFGRWVVISDIYLCKRWNKSKSVCDCICSCGTIRQVKCYSLVIGESQSCKCLNIDISTKHGKRYDKVYSAWRGMLNRCYNQSNPLFIKTYQNKGIKVCYRWLNFNNFFIDMGDPPKDMSLDRIDNNKGYNKKNCRWATRKTQQRNRCSVRVITFKGVKKSLPDWADSLNKRSSTLLHRFYTGWSIEKSLTTPLQHTGYIYKKRT